MDEPKAHPHYHDPDEKKRQLNRLARIIGHLQFVKKQIESDSIEARVWHRQNR